MDKVSWAQNSQQVSHLVNTDFKNQDLLNPTLIPPIHNIYSRLPASHNLLRVYHSIFVVLKN